MYILTKENIIGRRRMSPETGLVEIGCGGERVCPGGIEEGSEGGCLAARLTNQQ